MCIRWILVAVAGFLTTDCGSSSNASNHVDCESGYTSKEVCITCGATGGCGQSATKCARNCTAPSDCIDLQLFCSDGVCQVAGCI
jgi:hypothetical protein